MIFNYLLGIPFLRFRQSLKMNRSVHLRTLERLGEGAEAHDHPAVLVILNSGMRVNT